MLSGGGGGESQVHCSHLLVKHCERVITLQSVVCQQICYANLAHTVERVHQWIQLPKFT